ncbi:NIF-domain-containing protein [Lepidopterella palustris CBS 459.81]|uniref:Mitochondrial import inner membrane translocase subunit TIM50 n=1 Tax=Lepidopterella palustris CBS 459.81 TaxID=1314670 RepID=A0A8E2JAK6_9PEZI|nr:NIF-domain-containing protein [Lepidopterella palustris CBS 459.81]
MLPRAAGRALRVRAAPSPFPRASTSQRIRHYSKDDRPRPPKKPSPFEEERKKFADREQTWKPSHPINFAVAKESFERPAASIKPTPQSEKFPKDQPDYDTAATSERNRVPQSDGAGPSITEQAKVDQHAQEYYHKAQEEFSGPQSTEGNTAPITEGAEEPVAPIQPLPDLRQGIPSTFEAEFFAEKSAPKAHHAVNITEDPSKEPEPSTGATGGGREGGELPRSAYETSVDRRRNRMANYAFLVGTLFGITGAVYLGRNWETEEEEKSHPDAPSGWGFKLMYNRVKARISEPLDYLTEPTFPKLLPDMDPAPPYTLVLSLEDMLVHSEWTREHGWRTAKRPGVDYFLRYLSQYYELVIFTSLPYATAEPVIRKLDPFRVVMWPLFREATRYDKGEYVKDLSYLNRDLSKVILIDTKSSHAKLQPTNSIILKPWKGAPSDRELVSLIPFLEYVATMGITDVRSAISSFDGKPIPQEFARREAIAREAFNAQLAEERAKRPKHSAGGWLMGALGMKGVGQGQLIVGEQSAAEGFEQGKMLQDQIRERGMKQYEAMEKEIRENGEKWLKELAEEEKKLQEESMKSMKSGMVGWFGGKKD